MRATSGSAARGLTSRSESRAAKPRVPQSHVLHLSPDYSSRDVSASREDTKRDAKSREPTNKSRATLVCPPSACLALFVLIRIAAGCKLRALAPEQSTCAPVQSRMVVVEQPARSRPLESRPLESRAVPRRSLTPTQLPSQTRMARSHNVTNAGTGQRSGPSGTARASKETIDRLSRPKQVPVAAPDYPYKAVRKPATSTSRGRCAVASHSPSGIPNGRGTSASSTRSTEPSTMPGQRGDHRATTRLSLPPTHKSTGHGLGTLSSVPLGESSSFAYDTFESGEDQGGEGSFMSTADLTAPLGSIQETVSPQSSLSSVAHTGAKAVGDDADLNASGGGSTPEPTTQISRGLASCGFSGERSTVSPCSPGDDVSSQLRPFPAHGSRTLDTEFAAAADPLTPESVASAADCDKTPGKGECAKREIASLDFTSLTKEHVVADNAIEAWLSKPETAAGTPAQVQVRIWP
jgi:hypothetical protein